MNTSTNNEQLTLDPLPHYRIELRGRLDVEWLQSFDSSTEIIEDETAQPKDITILSVYSDQSGMIGLMRRLHGIGLTILKLQLDTETEV